MHRVLSEMAAVTADLKRNALKRRAVPFCSITWKSPEGVVWTQHLAPFDGWHPCEEPTEIPAWRDLQPFCLLCCTAFPPVGEPTPFCSDRCHLAFMEDFRRFRSADRLMCEKWSRDERYNRIWAERLGLPWPATQLREIKVSHSPACREHVTYEHMRAQLQQTWSMQLDPSPAALEQADTAEAIFRERQAALHEPMCQVGRAVEERHRQAIDDDRRLALQSNALLRIGQRRKRSHEELEMRRVRRRNWLARAIERREAMEVTGSLTKG